MKVCGVIVTYGDRIHLLSQVIDSLCKEMINEIVLIDNGSSIPKKLEELRQTSFPNLIIHRFEENTGTAKSFKKGIELATNTNCEFIWLLDDDTIAEAGSLQHLIHTWQSLYKKGNEKDLALCSYRKDRPNFAKAVTDEDANAILPLKNNFAGFHLKTFLSKIAERIFSEPKTDTQSKELVRINAASYGGLFFHKKLIEKIGLPDESYFLYVDDFDFSFRITKNNGQILLVTKSILRDLESSFYLPAKKKLLYHSALDAGRDSSAYYAIRNTIYFSKKNLISNKVMYSINRSSFLLLMNLLGSLRGKLTRLKTIRKAIRDGESGDLGSNADYKL